jgi:hypothetical protein
MFQLIAVLVIVAVVVFAVWAAWRDMNKKPTDTDAPTGFALGETFKTFGDK